MRIRPEHLASLQKGLDERFRERLVDHLAHSSGGSGEFDRRAALHFVQKRLPEAERFGLVTEAQVAAFIEASWVFGPNFPGADAWELQVLSSELNPPDLKAGWLVRRVDSAKSRPLAARAEDG